MAVAGLRYQMHCMVQGGDVLHGALMGLTCFAAGESVVGLQVQPYHCVNVANRTLR